MRCCFNIYKKPITVINKTKPNHILKDVKIKEHHRTMHPILDNNEDFRICSFGSSLGKSCKPNTYCKELCFYIINKYHKEKILNILKNTNYKKEFPCISTPYIATWQVYKYLKEQIPELE